MDGPEDLVYLTDLGFVGEVDGPVEERHLVVRELAHSLALACMHERPDRLHALRWPARFRLSSSPSPSSSPLTSSSSLSAPSSPSASPLRRPRHPLTQDTPMRFLAHQHANENVERAASRCT